MVEQKKKASFRTLRKNFFEKYGPELLLRSGEGRSWFLHHLIKVNDEERFVDAMLDLCDTGILEMDNMHEFSKAILRSFEVNSQKDSFYQKIRRKR